MDHTIVNEVSRRDFLKTAAGAALACTLPFTIASASIVNGADYTPPRRTIVDISVAIENDVPADPPPLMPKVTYRDHKEMAPAMASAFPGLDPSDLQDGEGWAIEDVQLTTHAGTHVDAPYHYHSTMDKGKPSITIDEIPLDWFFRPGIKLDFRHLPDGYLITAADVANELRRIDHKLNPLDIVLINTSAAAKYGQDSFVNSGCGMSRDATLYLLERGVRVAGTDAWSWDVPFSYTAERYRETKRKEIIWEGHLAGMEIGYCHMEKLSNLEAIPCKGFWVCCFPVKIRSASAGWTRAVAILDN